MNGKWTLALALVQVYGCPSRQRRNLARPNGKLRLGQ